MSSQIKEIAMPNGEGRFGEYGGRYVPPQLETILEEITAAYNAEAQQIMTQLYAAWAAGDTDLATQLQTEYYALTDKYNADVAALRQKYAGYPGFYG